MSHKPLSQIKKHSRLILLSGFVAACLAFLGSLFLPVEFSADAQMLLVSKTRYGVDPYTAVKSAERVGENLSRIVGTDLFFTDVLSQTQFSLDTEKFEGLTKRKQRKAWEKTIEANVVFGTGILNVRAYHSNKQQAINYANAAMHTMIDKGWEYVGGDVSMQVINQPVVNPLPARPGFIMNFFGGFILGMILMTLLVVWKRPHHFI